MTWWIYCTLCLILQSLLRNFLLLADNSIFFFYNIGQVEYRDLGLKLGYSRGNFQRHLQWPNNIVISLDKWITLFCFKKIYLVGGDIKHFWFIFFEKSTHTSKKSTFLQSLVFTTNEKKKKKKVCEWVLLWDENELLNVRHKQQCRRHFMCRRNLL